MRFFALALVLAVLAVSSVAADNSIAITVENADRRVDVRTQHVHIVDTLVLRNKGRSSLKSFLYCLPDQHVKQLASLLVLDVNSKKPFFQTRKPEVVAGIERAVQSDNSCFDLPFKTQLAKNAAATVVVHAILTKAQFPRPASITQGEPQRVLWETTAYLQSPYPVTRQTLHVYTEGEILNFTEAPPVEKKGKVVNYGPYENIDAAFVNFWIKFHYVNNAAFAAATQLDRELEVSHWGNIYVEERYIVKHYGAKFKGDWSRGDYTGNPGFKQASFREMFATMPVSAHTHYFKDSIGNVSSSQLLHNTYSTDASLAPRYPLFGGWSTDFVFGYSLPLRTFVTKSSKGVHTLKATLGPAVQRLVVDNLTVKVVLPEGAYDVKPKLDIEADSITYDTKYTYLDTAGRPVLILKLANMVDEIGGEFVVHYKMAPFAAFREPALLIGTLALLFACAIAYLRVDLSINKDAKWVEAQRKAQATATLQRILLLISERRRALALLDKAADGGNAGALAATKATVDMQLKSSTEKLKALAKEFEEVAAALGPALSELLKNGEGSPVICLAAGLPPAADAC